jgi:hypothetical protein
LETLCSAETNRAIRAKSFRDTKGFRDHARGDGYWLALIAAGRGIGVTPEGTTGQCRRDGAVFRPLRDAPAIAARFGWRRHDPHPATFAAVARLTTLYPADHAVSGWRRARRTQPLGMDVLLYDNLWYEIP